MSAGHTATPHQPSREEPPSPVSRAPARCSSHPPPGEGACRALHLSLLLEAPQLLARRLVDGAVIVRGELLDRLVRLEGGEDGLRVLVGQLVDVEVEVGERLVGLRANRTVFVLCGQRW